MKRKPRHDYQQGGAVRGPGTATSDSILARVSNGEYVLPKPAVDLVGKENLDRVRDMALSGYANGGLVAGTGVYPQQGNRLGKMAMRAGLESLFGVGPGVGGFVSGMTYSPDTQAQVLDVTQTREYRNAQNAARQGQTPLFGLGEAPEAALQRMQQQQALFDEQYRQMTGGPSPTEQRMLNEMNQFNPRAMPGYAMGGEVNRFGYDMSLTNRMNAGSDQMRDDRTSNWRSSMTQPSTPEQPDFMSGLRSIINPQQQAQDAYKSARGKADPLDVASGRFDREYIPQYADGGEIDLNRGLGVQLWERLNPETRERIQGALTGQGLLAPEMARTATNQRATPASGLFPPTDQNVGAGMPMGGGVPNRQPAAFLPQAFNPPSAPAMMSPPMAGRLPNMRGMLDPMAQRGRAQPLPTTPGPGAGGFSRVPDTDLYRRQLGGATNYAMPGQTAMGGGPGQAAFHGPRRDGGTLGYIGRPETAGMNQQQATAYNVAGIERQIEALRRLREARNPGITSGNVGGVRVVGKAGESFGSEVLDRDRFMRQFQPAPGRRMTARNQAQLVAAQQAWDQGRLAPQQLAAQQQAGALEREAGMRKAMLDYQQNQQNQNWEQTKFGATTLADLLKQRQAADQWSADYDLRQQQAGTQAGLQAAQTARAAMDAQQQGMAMQLFRQLQQYPAGSPERTRLENEYEMLRRGSLNPLSMMMGQ